MRHAYVTAPLLGVPDGDGGPARQAVGNPPPLVPPISIGEARRDADAGTALYNVDEGLRRALAAKLRLPDPNAQVGLRELAAFVPTPEEARATPRDVLLDELAGYYGKVLDELQRTIAAGDKRVEAQRPRWSARTRGASPWPRRRGAPRCSSGA